MRPSNRPLQAMALYSAILSQLVGSVLIGVYAGMRIDEKFGTAPLFLIILLFAGVAAGAAAMIGTVQKFDPGDR
ncbi:AtpZ/AtpI family protein [Indiicoccus explosivorum]|uniref:AtpZ/AtpI family protein n=1 Tax=Indiicoccus explosivorum TaxID=1917864 RepID=UPI000B43204A|nr:AtpZ/AtpI family protein [Indiicoccus explosivorum]